MLANNLNRGFTILEMVLVIAILSGLLGLGIYSFRPTTLFNDANKIKSDLEVGLINNALKAYYSEKGRYPDVFNSISSGTYEICRYNLEPCPTAGINLDILVDEKFIPEIPIRSYDNPNFTGYKVLYLSTADNYERDYYLAFASDGDLAQVVIPTPSSQNADNALLSGRVGGQTLHGGKEAGENLTLRSTSNTSKGKIFFGTSAYDEANDRLGVGNTSPGSRLVVKGISATSATSALNVLNSAETSALFVRDDRNVGIGTTSPNANLEIAHNGAGTFGVALRLNQNTIGNSDGPKIAFNKTMTASKKWTAGILDGVNVGDFAISEDGDYTGGFGTPRLTVRAGGNVGIGTTSPSAQLEILKTTNGITNELLRLSNSGVGTGTGGALTFANLDAVAGQIKTVYGADANWSMGLGTVGYLDTVTLKNGNVGIGTVSPTSLLSLAGIMDQTNSNPTLSRKFTGSQVFNYTADNQIRKVLQFTNADNTYKSGVIFGTVNLVFSGMETNNANPVIYVRRYNVRVRDWYAGAPYSMTAYLESIYEEGGQNKITLDVDSASSSTLVLKAKVAQNNGAFDSGSQLTVSFDLTSSAVQAGNFISSSFADGSTTTGNPGTQGTTILAGNGGNVGIGTTNPLGPLNIHESTGGDDRFLVLSTSFTGGNNFGINPFISGVDNGGFEIRDLTMGTSRMVIAKNTGNVGIGTASPGTHRLSVVGTAGLSSGTAWTNTSDSRLKNVETNLKESSILDKLLKLNPVSFRWNDLHNSLYGSDKTKLNYGFVAQEVEPIFPDMITTDENGYKWYNPSGFEAVLTASIQSQQTQITSNTQKVAEVANDLKDVQQKLEILTNKIEPKVIFNSKSGTTVLSESKTSVFVQTTEIRIDSLVMVTSETVIPYALAVTEKVPNQGFRVEIPESAQKDIKFSWLII